MKTASANQAKILSKFAHLDSPVVDKQLVGKATAIASSIAKSKGNENIVEHLDLLEQFIYRVPKDAIQILTSIIDTSTPLAPIKQRVAGYGDIGGKSHNDVLAKCANLLRIIRYLRPRQVLALLMKLAIHSDKDVCKEAINGIEELCTYNLHALQRIGYQPQIAVLNEIEKLAKQHLPRHISSLLVIGKELLNPSFEGQSRPDYKSVTIHVGTLNVTDELKDIRKRTIAVLQRLYGKLQNPSQQANVIGVLEEASQTPKQTNYGKEMEEMVVADVNRLVDWYLDLVPKAGSAVLLQIESQCQWFTRRFSDDKIPRLQELKSALASNPDYANFRIFAGGTLLFLEGKEYDFNKADSARQNAVTTFIDDIVSKNYGYWERVILPLAQRIVALGQGENLSFNRVLANLGERDPEKARKMIDDHEQTLYPVLAFFLQGIQTSKQPALAKDLIAQWIREGKHLVLCARCLFFVDSDDKRALKDVLAKARKAEDKEALKNILDALSVKDHFDAGLRKTLFVQVLRELTKYRETGWAETVGYRFTGIIPSLSERECDTVLGNLILIPNITFQSEELLSAIAKMHPLKIVRFFGKRVAHRARQQTVNFSFDAIPYNFHELGKILAEKSEIVLPEIMRWFSSKYLRWEADRFLRNIFPSFRGPLEATLKEYIRAGDDKSAKIVLSILNVYEGQAFLYDTCREFIKRHGKNEKHQRTLFLILSQTGVVVGEKGFVREYTSRKEAINKALGGDNDPAIQDFLKEFNRHIDARIAFEEKRSDEEIELVKRGLD